MAIERRLKFPHCAWESREQFVEHFWTWVRFYRRGSFGLSGLVLLRSAYRQARTGYNPNPAF